MELDNYADLEALDLPLDVLVGLRFDDGMNILNLVIDHESEQTLNYLCRLMKDHPDLSKELVNHSFGKNKLQAIHQACSFGILSQITRIVDDFGANVNNKVHNQLTTLHCAAQTTCGYLSILVLVEKYKMDPSIEDNFKATPLHFAIINKEFKNVELLIALGANVNA